MYDNAEYKTFKSKIVLTGFMTIKLIAAGKQLFINTLQALC
jgi:hypothetical protein